VTAAFGRLLRETQMVSLSAGRFARGCSFPAYRWDLFTNDFLLAKPGVVENRVMAGGTPATPAALVS
jgi:hypothetical protein